MSVPAAGKRYFDLGKNGSYDAARRGEIPTIKIGARLRVPVIALERMLAEACPRKPAQELTQNTSLAIGPATVSAKTLTPE
jgi:hypothetical protein